uniref:Aminotransferase-like plant mobile domain-containing protein n=1 Tax=Tanacetum cinerariifolium TaxID=118510 RepID=A0A6L2MFP7_TANCI|nr:hypothetical protein [Tanacetum cinerariifolium]
MYKMKLNTTFHGWKVVFILETYLVVWAYKWVKTQPDTPLYTSAKESIFATSSAEAEYIAAFDASKEAVWVRKYISRLGVVPTIEEPISMYCDISGAITIANESGIPKGARHFHAKVYYLREVIEFGDIKLEKVHTDDNLADPFTKALAFPKHSKHTRNIGILPASSLMVTEFVNPKDYKKPIQEVIAKMTNGGVDRSVECTSHIDAMISAFECVHDELELEKFITHEVPFSKINKAFDLMLKVKVFVASFAWVNRWKSGTFELAIFLARGWKMALAPAVLATLYKDLHLLQNAVLDLQQGKTEVLQQVFSPMHHIQVWVLERCPRIRPDGMCSIRDDETRLARWAKSVNKSTDYAALESGTCEEHFVWRPYVKDTKRITARTIYKEDARVEKIDKEEMDSFARCVRVSKLVWLDISQQYFPHRVSKQFGYNQDIPADVLHLESNEDAWADYATSMENEYIYLPSRQLEGHVTVRSHTLFSSCIEIFIMKLQTRANNFNV